MTRNRRAAATSALVFTTIVAAALCLRLDPAFADDKAQEKKSKTAEPFYRKYLVPGAPLDDQIREQEKRIEANPNSAELHNDMGNLLAERRFPKEARHEYETAMKLDKTNWMAPYNLGLLEELQGHRSSAISAYEKSVDRNRGFATSRFRLARLYEQSGRLQDAVREYSTALEIDPQMRDVRHNPLVADTHLLDRISVTNYQRDVLRAEHRADAAWVDPTLRRLPMDRPVFSGDLQATPESETVDSPAAAPRNPAPIPPRPGETRPQQDLGTRPAAPPAPANQPVQPTAAPPAQDPLMLGTRPQPPPLPTPLPQ
jgi:tetratricopeptide (TPR) repeat protein